MEREDLVTSFSATLLRSGKVKLKDVRLSSLCPGGSQFVVLLAVSLYFQSCSLKSVNCAEGHIIVQNSHATLARILLFSRKIRENSLKFLLF